MLISFIGLNSYAQYTEVKPHEDKEEKGAGFQKDHLFTGGGVNLSLSNYNFGIGLSPVLGYSFNKWFDAGIGFGFTYVAAREVYDDGYEVYATGRKIRQTDIAPFLFARAYPIKFLFVQAQLEQNFISQKYIYGDGGPDDKVKFDATSLLAGIGYCGGREDVGDMFYYISLSIDVLKNKNSPYVQITQSANGGYAVSFLPILKAGIQIPLFQGKK